MSTKRRNKVLSELLFVAGVASITVGTFMWSAPFGLVVSGLMFAGIGYKGMKANAI